MKLGPKIKSFRTAQGMSQTELARKMSERCSTRWYQNTVSRVEQGDREVKTLQELRALQSILGDDVIADTPAGDALARLSQATKQPTTARVVTDALSKIRDVTGLADPQAERDKFRALIARARRHTKQLESALDELEEMESHLFLTFDEVFPDELAHDED